MTKSQCFVQWQGWTQVHASNRVAMHNAVCHSLQVLRLRRYRWLAHAVSGWVADVSARKARRRIIRRAVLFARRTTLLTSFATWFNAAGKRRKLSETGHRLMFQFQHRRVTSVFSIWRAEVRDSRNRVCSAFDIALDEWKIDRVLSEHEEEISAMNNRFRILHSRVVAIFTTQRTSRVLRAVLKAWLNSTAVDKHRRKVVADAIVRIEMVVYGTVFDDWVFWMRTKQSRLVTYHRALKRLRSMKLSSFFSRWSTLPDWLTVSTTTVRMRGHILKRLRKLAVRVLGAWNQWAARSAAVCRVLRRAVERSLQSSLASVFCAWHGQTYASRVLRTALAQTSRRTRHLRQQNVFARWLTHLSVVRRMRKVAHRLRLLRTATAFDTWTDTTEQWKAQKARAKHDAMIASLRITFQAVQDRASQRMQEARMKNWIKVCLEHWRTLASAQSKLQQLAAVAMQRFRGVRLMECFDGWLLFVQSQVHMRRLHDRTRRRAGQHRNAGIPLGPALESWLGR